MERINKQIELAKDAFIIYIAKRFENDKEIQDSLSDIRYLESKKTAMITSKRRKEDRERNNF